MSKLTPEQIDSYVKTQVCPYCEGTDVVSDYASYPTSKTTIVKKTNCENCGRKWFDVYNLVGIEEIEEQERFIRVEYKIDDTQKFEYISENYVNKHGSVGTAFMAKTGLHVNHIVKCDYGQFYTSGGEVIDE